LTPSVGLIEAVVDAVRFGSGLAAVDEARVAQVRAALDAVS